MSTKPLEINSKIIQIMKPLTCADYTKKTVLTNSSWEYVELWLKRINSERSSKALFYWKQAYDFYNASKCLPIESKPLTSYYCCLNATKALLAINSSDKIDFDNLTHGITSDRKQWKTSNIKDAKVTFLGSGVLAELSKYLNEDFQKREYNVYDLMYNIPCIHRTFALTYNCSELFIPIRDVSYVINTDLKKGWLQFIVDKRYDNGNSLRNLPKKFERVINTSSQIHAVRSKKRFKWDIHEDKQTRLNSLSKYHSKMRKFIHYIYADTRLWYIKKDIPTNKHIIARNSLTLIFSTMHWLSELARYNPEKFHSIMNSKQNWLIHEFIETALYHFVDEVSCEMTHVDIMPTGYRK